MDVHKHSSLPTEQEIVTRCWDLAYRLDQVAYVIRQLKEGHLLKDYPSWTSAFLSAALNMSILLRQSELFLYQRDQTGPQTWEEAIEVQQGPTS